MHAHRIDILDRADDDAVIVLVAHNLHLILFPAEQRFLDQHLGGRARLKARADDLLELGLVIGDAAARAAQREARPDDRGQAGACQHGKGFLHRMRHARAGRFEANLVHRLAETLAVFGLVDGVGIGADHLDAVLLQRAVVKQAQRRVQRRLPAHCWQQRIGALLGDDLGDDFGRDRLYIGRVGHFRVGHDGGGVRVHQDHPVALFLQRLDRLRARIVELASLTDNDRPRANDEDRGDVSAFGH